MGYKKDEQGTWCAWFCRRNPKSGQPVSLRRTRIKSEREAQRVERELVRLVEERIQNKLIPSWASLIQSYLKASLDRGLNAKTVYNAEKCLIARTSGWMGRRVDEISTQEIRDLVHGEMTDYSIAHQKTVLKFVRGVFAHGVDLGVLNRNPTPLVHFRSKDKIRSVLTEEQTRVLLTKARDLNWPWYPHYSMALYTGMRNGELFALTWDKVSLPERKIVVDCSWNSKDGLKETKSGHDRVIEIAPALLPVLEALNGNSGGLPYVLPRVGHWDKGEQARELRMFLQGIGLPRIRFHDLRATWATLLLGKGVEPVKVMAMGGWRDMKTMMVYIRKAGIDVRGCLNTLDLHKHHSSDAKVLSLSRAATL